MTSDKKRILLAKKPGEDLLRFVGGFVDPTDGSLEHAASREFREETGGAEISGFKYIGSFRVNDWRYRSERDKIMTALFIGTYAFGSLTPSDDISSLEWVETSTFLEEGWIQKNVMEEHWPLALALATELKTSK
jgi:bifunctional NMN adenylyltransferase/nudix hydrolase